MHIRCVFSASRSFATQVLTSDNEQDFPEEHIPLEGKKNNFQSKRFRKFTRVFIQLLVSLGRCTKLASYLRAISNKSRLRTRCTPARTTLDGSSPPNSRKRSLSTWRSSSWVFGMSNFLLPPFREMKTDQHLFEHVGIL